MYNSINPKDLLKIWLFSVLNLYVWGYVGGYFADILKYVWDAFEGVFRIILGVIKANNNIK